MPARHCYWMILSVVICCFAQVTAIAQSRSAAQLLPETTALYLELTGYEHLAGQPFSQRVITSEPFRQVWRSANVMKLRGGITLAEVALGERLTTVATKLTDQGAVIAADLGSKGVVFLGHARDSDTCQNVLQKLIDVARKDAANKGRADTVRQRNYRGIDAYEINGVLAAAIEDWIVLTNQGELGKGIIDRSHDSQSPNLAKRNTFMSARAAALPLEDKRLAWGWVDVDLVRSKGGAKALFQSPRENFVLELAIGGLLAVARDADYAVGSLSSDADRLQLALAVPQSSTPQKAEYAFFFGPEATGHAQPLLAVPQTLASISVYRDLALLWRSAGDLFGQRTNDQLAQAETTLTTLFSGRDFGEEILGAIQPELRLVIAAQDFSDTSLPQPQIKLPAFALVTKLRQPTLMQPQLKRIFQSLIGFVNVTGAMNQQPQLDLETIKDQDATLVQATYAREVDRPQDWVVPVQYNFAPTLALWQDHAILASSTSLAQATLLQLRQASVAGPSTASISSSTDRLHPNTLIHLEGTQIATVLGMNRQQLISQNMLEKGHSEETAAGEVDTVLGLARLIQAFDLQCTVGRGVELNMSLSLQPN